MPRITTVELIATIARIYPSLTQEKRDRARYLIKRLDEEEEREDTNQSGERILDWQAAVYHVNQFLRDNMVEGLYEDLVRRIT